VNTADFQVSFGETVLRSDMEVGPAKVRRRNTKGIDKFSASIDLSVAEYTTFKNFYTTSLNGGVLSFNFDHPITREETEFRFAETPNVRPLGGIEFRVTMVWEEVP
jgi:hypothetical protein